MWCSACGSEYRSGYSRCPDCDVALVASPPPRADADHDRLEYDLAGWTSTQREAAAFWLARMEIPAEWRPDGVLLVPSAREIQVDDLIDSLHETRRRRRRDARRAGGAAPPIAADALELAGPGRRLAGFLIDYVVLTAAAALFYTMIGGRGMSVDMAVVVTDAVYFVAGTAIWGRTVGKLVVHTEVVRVDGITPPGLRVAAIRYAVVAFAIPLSYFGALGGWASFVWTIAVYVPIFGAARPRAPRPRRAHRRRVPRPSARTRAGHPLTLA